MSATNWKNVNNWHWVDKNCLPWAKEYFTQKLLNLKHSDNGIEIEVTNLKSVDGDCDLNQRKGQIIHIFDLKLILEWVGRKGNLEATGKIEIPEFMHDTKFNEIVLDITMDSPTREKYDIKEFARVGFGPFLRKQFENFHADLMDAHSKDVYISNEDMVGHPVTTVYKPKPPVVAMAVEPSSAKGQVGGLVTITQNIEFQCSVADLYNTLVDRQKIQVWSRAPAEFSTDKGSQIVLFGGNITGSLISNIPNEKIEMTWRVKTWPSEHFSNVLITFEEKKDCTILKLVQTKVPVGEKDSTEANWKNYYWNSIKRTFGFGMVL